MSNSLWPHRLEPSRHLCPWDSLGKNTEVGSHFLLLGSSRLRDQTQVSCLAGRFLTIWAAREAPGRVEKCWTINRKGGRIDQRSGPGLLNAKSQSEIESHEYTEAAICFIIIFSPLGYLHISKNKTDIWIHPEMGFCDKGKETKKIMILVRVVWCDKPCHLNWVWWWWTKEEADELGNESGDGKICRDTRTTIMRVTNK